MPTPRRSCTIEAQAIASMPGRVITSARIRLSSSETRGFPHRDLSLRCNRRAWLETAELQCRSGPYRRPLQPLAEPSPPPASRRARACRRAQARRRLVVRESRVKPNARLQARHRSLSAGTDVPHGGIYRTATSIEPKARHRFVAVQPRRAILTDGDATSMAFDGKRVGGDRGHRAHDH
jgi:hypothetical protein